MSTSRTVLRNKYLAENRKCESCDQKECSSRARAKNGCPYFLPNQEFVKAMISKIGKAKVGK
jgi:hypothetical protein